MTFKKHIFECDRCGTEYTPKDPDNSAYVMLPEKTIPTAPVKGENKQTKKDMPALMMMPLVPGVDPEQAIKEMMAQQKKPEPVVVGLCTECEISLMNWFNVVKLEQIRKEWK